jgi:outer membrane receptor protein involved in Fe transport
MLRNGRIVLCFLAVLAVFAFANQSSHAQAVKATILGVVTDSSGATIPGAKVTATNSGTGITRTATTDSQGRYTVADLDIGTYEVDAEAAGFKRALHTGIELTVGSEVVVDAALQVGASQQTVTVEGQVTQVDTTSSALGSLVEGTQMRELPLNGRNYAQLLSLAPGVSTAFYSGSGLSGRGVEYSVSGSRTFGQAYLLDNTDISDFFGHGVGSGAAGSSLGIDAIAEFQVLTDTYSSQYGGSGAVLNAVSKGGTNSFHGTAFEFLRNSAIQSRNYFDPTIKPPFRRNQFGGSVGGPIKKDKAFFFVNYEGLRQVLSQSDVIAVPDAAAHQGYLPNSAGVETPVNLPGSVGLQSPSSCTTTYTATSNCNLANIASTLALFPVATGPSTGGIGSSTEIAPQTTSENYLLARFDYNFSDKDSLFVRYIRDYAQLTTPNQLPLWNELENTANHIATIEERHLFSPDLINLARFSFVRPAETSFNPTTHAALQFYPGLGIQDGAVAVSGLMNTAQNYLGATNTDPIKLVTSRYIEGDDILWTHGAHSLRFGASVARVDDNSAADNRGPGSYSFSNLTNFLKDVPSSYVGTLPGQQNATRYFRELYFATYFQDDWKLTRKLTLNLGLRYAPTSNFTEAHNNLYTIINPPGTCVAIACFVNVPNTLAHNPSWWNFDPRIGLAYDPFGDHKTSVRAGFGMFHDVMTARAFGPAYWFNPPFTVVSVTSGQQALTYGCVTAGCPGAGNIIGAAAPSTSNDISYTSGTTPYMMQYNLNIQRELPGSWIATIGYVGSQGRHLFLGRDLNAPENTGTATDPVTAHLVVNANGTGTIVTNPRPNPTLSYFTNTAPVSNSNYNSLQASLNHRFAHGLQTQVSYTYSKSLDLTSQADGTEEQSSLGSGTPNSSDPYIPRADYGPSLFDRRHNLIGNAVYALPFHGNKFVEGWELSGIVTVASGFPFAVTTGSFDLAGLGNPNVYQRVNLAPGCTPKSAMTGNRAKWFNPACFTLPLVGHYGDLSRNSLTSPGLRNLDFAILKDTRVPKVSETFDVQFRAEAFNLFNHTDLGLPVTGLFSQGPVVNGILTGTLIANAGTFSSTIAPQRTLQFGVKILF